MGSDVEIRQPYLFRPAHQRRLRRLVSEDTEAKPLWQAFRREAETLTGLAPRPLPVLHYEGLLNTDPRRIETQERLRDMDALAALTHAYAASGEAAFRDAARRVALAWADAFTPTGNPINENKLEPVLTAAGTLADDLPAGERERLRQWARRLADAEIASGERSPNQTRNNWHTKRLKLATLAGEVTGDGRFLDYARRGAREYVTHCLHADGTSNDLHERDALSYHQSGLKPLLVLVMRSDAGLYSWTAPTGASLRKSVEYVVPYANGTKKREEWRNTRLELDRRRAAAGIGEYQPGKLFEPAQAAELFELASFFDPEMLPLAAKLAGSTARRFPTWTTVLNAAVKETP